MDVVLGHLPTFGAGLELTLLIAICAIACGSLLGVFTAIARMTPVGVLRWAAAAYVELIRNTPGLVQLLFVYLALPQLGIRLSPLWATVAALTVNNGAYLAEIFRGGLQATPKGQLEAAAAIGLSRSTTLVEVVLPQAFRAIYPALANQFIQTVLASSIGSIIAANELTQVALIIDSQTYRTVDILIALTIIYALLTMVIALVARVLGERLERRYR